MAIHEIIPRPYSLLPTWLIYQEISIKSNASAVYCSKNHLPGKVKAHFYKYELIRLYSLGLRELLGTFKF